MNLKDVEILIRKCPLCGKYHGCFIGKKKRDCISCLDWGNKPCTIKQQKHEKKTEICGRRKCKILKRMIDKGERTLEEARAIAKGCDCESCKKVRASH